METYLEALLAMRYHLLAFAVGMIVMGLFERKRPVIESEEHNADDYFCVKNDPMYDFSLEDQRCLICNPETLATVTPINRGA